MSKRLNITFDSDLIEQIAAQFDLREPNKQALRTLIFTLDGSYDPQVMQVLNLATGVGKTYLMAAFIEYLRCQGVRNVMIVTPNKVVQAKTIQNFIPGTKRYIAGSACPPSIVTPQDYSAWRVASNGNSLFSVGNRTPVLTFIFNIQQLIAPKSLEGDTNGKTQDAARRKPRRFDESSGVLFEYLQNLDDLVVIADESHLYSESAAAFNSALVELDPAATIGLTASALPNDHVIYKYALYEAIRDKYVKTPVLTFRKEGYGEDKTSEEQQLHDAHDLREFKQRFYDAYCDQYDLAHLNAIMFVVCADTSHAEQVTALLRTPRYFNKESAVLLVDSNHDDEATNTLLENLDLPNSPVRCVVSVNKLKEGWDVKNIAVVVTLRAMASEVLTQQTMGRGLRLPFGKYTGILQIDQLDIIAHQSFKELLESENVLTQFGLEDAVAETDKSSFEDAIKQVALQQKTTATETTSTSAVGTLSQNATQTSLVQEQNPYTSDIHQQDDQSDSFQIPSVHSYPAVQVQTVEERVELFPGSSNQNFMSIIEIERNPSFADVEYWFPSTKVEEVTPKIELSGINPSTIESAAKRVTSTGDVLVRKEIIVAIDSKKLKVHDTETAEVESIAVDAADVELALARLVLNGQLIPITPENKIMVEKFLVKNFMKHVQLDHWTVKAVASAKIELDALVKSYVKEVLRNKTEHTTIVPVKQPAQKTLKVPLGHQVHEQIESQAEFVRHRFYSGWFKSLFEAESFDSYTGEYLLAKLLNTSPHIVWWHRLHPQDGARVAYTVIDNYYPDFVALDDQGVYWIIEGKDARGRENDTVQAKRKAAEKVVLRLLAEEAFVDNHWGYLIAYEDDVKASDSWDDLKTRAQPITNE